MSRLIRNIKSPSTYIRDIKEHSEFGISNITVEHRSNNPKRDYLFVNKKQCKHIPSSPYEMIRMCKRLAEVANEKLANTVPIGEKVLVIGFAETATAIGNFVADNLCCDAYVLQTTREEVKNSKEIVHFEEEHSHATTQKLLTYAENPINLKDYCYILFVEDEISTGNTILNFIDAFEKEHGTFKYGVASICNWQNTDDRNRFIKKGIDVFALITGELIDRNAKMLKTSYEEDMINKSLSKGKIIDGMIICNSIGKGMAGDDIFRETRLGHSTKIDLSKLHNKVLDIVTDNHAKSIRVIGTEEFMYIPIRVGAYLEYMGFNVICHSTTRSPIDVLEDNGRALYGVADSISSKCTISSIYEDDRKNFIYNLDEHTDMTIIITDGEFNNEHTLMSFYSLLSNSTDKIIVVGL